EHKPGPGLFIGLPWGLDQVDRIPVGLVRSVTIGTPEGEAEEPTALLTGDHNLVTAQADINYRVIEDQVERFALQRDRVNAVVARTAEAAMAEWVAGRDVDTVLLRGKAVLPGWLVGQLRERLAPYQLGVQVESVSVAILLPPKDVRAAF